MTQKLSIRIPRVKELKAKNPEEDFLTTDTCNKYSLKKTFYFLEINIAEGKLKIPVIC